MYTTIIGTSAAFLAICIPASTPAAPVQWSGNGHYYSVVSAPGSTSWDDANAAATAAGGYLATITSQAENAFVFSLVNNATYWHGSSGPWLGGYQSPSTEPGANWHWVTGEPWNYTYWQTGQPNDSEGNEEDKLQYGFAPLVSTWNDISVDPTLGYRPVAYVIEFATVPEAFSSNDVVTLKCRANNAYVTVQPVSLNLAATRAGVGVLQEFSILDGGGGSYALKARYNGTIVCAESAGALPLIANRTGVALWEQFDLVTLGGDDYALRARVNSNFVSAAAGNLIANKTTAATDWEKFVIQTNPAAHAAIGWRVVQPTLNTNEVIVAACTPQDYGAKGDGLADDSAAFQDAATTVGASGGGVIYIPAGFYSFYTNISIPDGVTLHGDWADWRTNSAGAVGTIFKVYPGRGSSNDAPFITLYPSTALKGVSIWYPEQDPANIVPYSFCIRSLGVNAVQDVILVNAYQGYMTGLSDNALHIVSSVYGSPLSTGIQVDQDYDISHLEDIAFHPDVWAASKLPGAPAAGGPHAAWMRTNGTAIRLLRVDGENCMDLYLSGYKVGLEANHANYGPPSGIFYSGAITNCGTALLAIDMAGQTGLMFTKFKLEGDVAVNAPAAVTTFLQFHSCELTGRSGTAVIQTSNAWNARIQFQNCTINGTLRQDIGTLAVVNSTLNVALGSNHLVMGSSPDVKRAAFVGCNFNPARTILNPGSVNRLILDDRRPTPSPMPEINWSQIKQDYLSRRPARTNLFVATSPPWNAKGDRTTDSTSAIQAALNAAGANGGGIVFLPGGEYKLLGSLTVPPGVELRGPSELRARMWPGADGKIKGCVLEPYGGAGATNGTPAVMLQANSGLRGLRFSYEAQNPTNLVAYPPTIQGRSGNIYLIGVVSPNSWTYVDLDTFTCTNHLLYLVDGFALRRGFVVGNGSAGTIADCHANWTYWWDNYNSSSCLNCAGDAAKAVVQNFTEHNNEAYVLGDCTELLVKNFWIITRTFTRCVMQNARGPNVNAFAHFCDAAVEGFRFDAAVPGNFNAVNSDLAIFTSYADLTNATVGIVAASNYTGAARFFNTSLFARPAWDFIIGGGDVHFDLIHMFDHSINGARVDGGTLRLINKSSWIAYDQTFPVYQVYFGANAGSAGRVSELAGCSAANGVQYANDNSANVVKAWANFPLLALTSITPYSLTAPRLQLKRSGNDLTLSWPGDIGYFGLYEMPDLPPPARWTPVTNTPLYTNSQWQVALPSSSSSSFYRLATP